MKTPDENEALAVIFANTKRKKRTEDLITVAEAFQRLAELYGSQRAVAKKVGLSAEIVREFCKILTLPAKVQDMVRTRVIDRLDIAYRISQLRSREEQEEVAAKVAQLATDDVRDIKRLISAAGLSVEQSTKRVLDSRLKGLHVFVMDFDDEQYRAILERARSVKVDPAELVKKVVLGWLKSAPKAGSSKRK